MKQKTLFVLWWMESETKKALPEQHVGQGFIYMDIGTD